MGYRDLALVPMTVGGVTLDEAFLLSLQSFDDAQLGIREAFLQPALGGKGTVAILATPQGRRHDLGWVICHSFGMEQMYLQRLEVAAARALAASGCPVLRYHSQGYGDSDGSTLEVSVESQVRDAQDAAALLVSSAGVERVGLLGARFGGSVAAITAARSGAACAVLWDPVVHGQSYIDALVRSALVTQLAGRGKGGADGDPRERLRRGDVLDVQGFPVRDELYRELASLDLETALPPWPGDALVVQIATSGQVKPELGRLVDRLATHGGTASCEVLVDPAALAFGQSRYRVTGQREKADTQAVLSQRLVDTTVAWCERWLDDHRSGPRGEAG